MAHYAFLDDENIVTEVITGVDETELIEGVDPEIWYGQFRGQRCVRTSYNNRIRGHFAGIGHRYDADRDIFIAPQPFPSWVMKDDGLWEPPVSYPSDNKPHYWDENTTSWIEMAT